MEPELAASNKFRGLGRCWRFFGTALSFAVFGIGGIVLGLFWFPLLFVLLRNPVVRQQKARSLVGRCFRGFVWMMKSLGVLSYEIHGKEHMGDIENTLIVANHPTLIDVVFLVGFFPQSECVIKRAVTRNPFFRGVVGAANYISNSDPEIMLNDCADRLRSGGSLILFPEGTRREQNAELKFRMGAATIAVRAGARVMPIVIDCQPPTLRKNEAWYKIPRSRPHWKFEINPASNLDAFIDPVFNQRQDARNLQAALLRFFESRIPGVNHH